MIFASDTFKKNNTGMSRATTALAHIIIEDNSPTIVDTTYSSIDPVIANMFNSRQLSSGRLGNFDYKYINSYNETMLGFHVGWKPNDVSDNNGNISCYIAQSYGDDIREYSTILQTTVFNTIVDADVYMNGELFYTVRDNISPIISIPVKSYKTAISSLRVNIKRVSVPNSTPEIVAFGPLYSVILTASNISALSITDETIPAVDRPVEGVCFNQMVLAMDSAYGALDPNSSKSILYKKIHRQTKIFTYMGVKVADSTFEMLPYGVYYVDKISSPIQSVTTSLTCYDELFFLAEKDTPFLPIIRNVTAKQLILLLLKNLGVNLRRCVIDSRGLDYLIPIGWFKGPKVRNSLNEIAASTNCIIKMRRDNTIFIRSLSYVTTENPVITLSDSNFDTLDRPFNVTKDYSDISITYSTPNAPTDRQVASLSNIKIPVGGVYTSDNIRFQYTPVVNISKIDVTSSKDNGQVVDFSYSPEYGKISIKNVSDEMITVTIKIYAYASTLQKSTVSTGEEKGSSIYSVDNSLIQTQSQATQLVKDYERILTNKNAVLNYKGVCDLTVETMDNILMNSKMGDFEGLGATILRITTVYDGGVYWNVTSRKRAKDEDVYFLSNHMIMEDDS